MSAAKSSSMKDDGEIAGSPLWLGLDISTQSLTLVLLPDTPGASHIYLDAIIYARDLPQYQTEHGMHISDGDDGEKNAVVTSPVTMWLDAIDMAFSRLAALADPPTSETPAEKEGTDDTGTDDNGTDDNGTDDKLPWGRAALRRVRALSVSGQQHGTVFWKNGARERLEGLARLGRKDTLLEALGGWFARRDCPIWADSSTSRDCRTLEEALGGPEAVAQATGSTAYCRFSGNQIARVARREPGTYAACERVSLVSSFVTSVFAGRYCSIDASDASGMNLMDIRSKDWHEGALAASNAPGLREKLGPVCPSHACQGTVTAFFTNKFDLNPKCIVVSGSGDNPCALAGLGLSEEGPVVVSLGTSDTVIGITKEPCPQKEGHVMVNPVQEDSYFVMLVYKNGALGRQRVRDEMCGSSWEEFDDLLRSTPAGNGGRLGLFIDMPEITPQINITGRFRRGPSDEFVEQSFSPGEEARAVVEGRFLSMRGRLMKMGIPPPEAVLATGGGSNSPAIMQILADVFNAPVYLKTVSDAAAIGAALRAKHGLLCLDLDDKERSSPPACGSGGASTLATDNDRCNEMEGKYVPFCSVLAGGGDDPTGSPSSSSATGALGASEKVPRKASYTRGLRLAASPRPDAEDLYADMIRRYDKLEEDVKQMAAAS